MTDPAPEKEVKDEKQDESESSSTGCVACGLDNNGDSILLCDGCNAEYHIYCLVPPLNEVPDGDFYCVNCSGKQEYEIRASKEIDEDEVDNFVLESTQYEGVYRRWYVKSKNKVYYKPYVAQVESNSGRPIQLGLYRTEELAAEAYDVALLKSHGISNVAQLKFNYPAKIEKYKDIITSNHESSDSDDDDEDYGKAGRPARTRKPPNKLDPTADKPSKRRNRIDDDSDTTKRRKIVDYTNLQVGDLPTKYRGVLVFHNYSVAQLKVLDKVIFIGRYDTPEEAALAYDREAVRHYCRGTPLNFPERREELTKQAESNVGGKKLDVPENRYNKNVNSLTSWMKTVGQTVKLIEASRRVQWPSLDIEAIEKGPVIEEQFTERDKKLRDSSLAVFSCVDSIIQESKFYQEKSPSGMFLNPPPAGCFLELVAPQAYINYCKAVDEFSKSDLDDTRDLSRALALVLNVREEYKNKKISEDAMLQELEDFMSTAIKSFEPSKLKPEDPMYYPDCKYIKRKVPIVKAIAAAEETEVKAEISAAAKSIEEGQGTTEQDVKEEIIADEQPEQFNEECCLAVKQANDKYELYPLLTVQRVMVDETTPLQWAKEEVEAHEVSEMDAFTFGLDISPTSTDDIVPHLCLSFMHEMTHRAIAKEINDVSKAKKVDKYVAVKAKYNAFMETFPKTQANFESDTQANQAVRSSAQRDLLLLETMDSAIPSAVSSALATCMVHLKTYVDTLNARREQFATEFNYYTGSLQSIAALEDSAPLKTSYVSFFTRELHALWKEKYASLEILYLLLRSMSKAANDDPEADEMLTSIREAITAWEVFEWPDLVHTKPYLSTKAPQTIQIKKEPAEAVDELKDVIQTTLRPPGISQLVNALCSCKFAVEGHKKETKPLTLVVYHPVCIRHQTPREHPECPERLTRAIATLKPLMQKYPKALTVLTLDGTAAQLSPPETTLLLVHSPNYLDQLKDRSSKAAARSLVFETDPGDDNDGIEAAAPDTIRPFAGVGGAFKVAASIKKDSVMDTYVSSASWDVARIAAGTVCLAVDKVLNGEFKNAVCLVRPPGHHVGRNGRTPNAPSSGFCLLNNVVIGALHARMHPSVSRIAVLDWDIHHGNGTEELLRGDPRSFFASIHLYDNNFFPGTGATGADANVVNVGLANSGMGSGSEAFRHALTTNIFPAMESFKPDIIFISAGFDGHKDDIIGGCAAVGNRNIPAGYVEADYAWATKEVLKLADKYCDGRVVSVLEGGYDVRDETNSLAKSIAAHIDAIVDGSVEINAANEETQVKVEPQVKVEGRLAHVLNQPVHLVQAATAAAAASVEISAADSPTDAEM
ncbi:unnamed protein product [Aphanomyces euteiches]